MIFGMTTEEKRQWHLRLVLLPKRLVDGRRSVFHVLERRLVESNDVWGEYTWMEYREPRG